MKKIIVITGSTSGIGNDLVKKFSDENIVFAGYRDEEQVIKLKKISSNVIPFYIDLEKKQSIRQAAAYIKSKTKNIDTLINVAGCVIAGALEHLDADDIRKQFEVNTFSHLDFTQRLLPLINEGKIINISSKSSFGIFPFIAPYCASKRALDILFNSLQLEIHKNIKIVSVKPGSIATPIWHKSIELNKKSIKKAFDCYQKEMEYLIDNAKKNTTKGINVKKVTDKILKINSMQNPKSSYTIGFDAMLCEILSRFPQDWINFVIKLEMKRKIK